MMNRDSEKGKYQETYWKGIRKHLKDSTLHDPYQTIIEPLLIIKIRIHIRRGDMKTIKLRDEMEMDIVYRALFDAREGYDNMEKEQERRICNRIMEELEEGD
jgi:hypothetical protein